MNPETERCGVVAVIGAPNAGKSTLVNALVGQKVAIVSPKVQTTRTRLIGIAIEGDAQLLLVDTPGIFAPRRRLDRAMVSAAWEGTTGADVVVLVVDARAGLKDEVSSLLDAIAQRPEPKMLALNKVDVAPKEKLLKIATAANERVPFAETFMISAKTGDGVDDLKAKLTAAAPEGPWHFPADQVSDVTTRLLAAEITREQIYRQLHEELPYATTVETEKWEERRDGSAAIHQQILVERETQKAIVLGKGGAQIKKLGAAARAELQEQLGRRIHLFLHVKVKPDWAEDRGVYRDMGLGWVE
ncbi:GTPase Era [Sphingoaurantiacus capsulatus]|uniref:GTPase Era n=1 Tax=Sphingoaurantiacus capsulatus TaxID=1771310 RepID=A0ABV7X701_9SPHN